jgi:pyridoxal biosynthesis lyase PdxS
MAAVRVPLMAAVLIGGFINARHAEEFVRKAYLDACAIAVPISAVFFYAVVEFRIPFARFASAYLLTIWLACWIVASARLQRA